MLHAQTRCVIEKKWEVGRVRSIVLVAPVRSVAYTGERYKDIEILSPDDQFVDRDTQHSTLTSPAATVIPIAGVRQVRDTLFRLDSVTHFNHWGEDFIVAMVTAYHDFADRKCVVELENATFTLIQNLIFEIGEESDLKLGSPRWVNRTMVTYDKQDPALHHWFQDNSNTEFHPLGAGSVEGIAGWGNNALWLSPGGEIPEQVLVGLVLAQFVWSYAGDIEKYSLEILQKVQVIEPNKQGHLLRAVVDLHYELAVQSVFYERLEVEADPLSRRVAKSLLNAWSYEKVLGNIEDRINRLEHILTARSELLRRSSSVKMERILFAVTMTTIVSLILGFIQTSFSGAVGEAPGGPTMDFFRDANLDWIFSLSLIACAALSYQVLRRSGKVRNPLEK